MKAQTDQSPAERRGTQLDELLALPVAIDLDTSNRVLNIGRTKGFLLAKRGQYPCRVMRIGNTYRVSRADLLRLLNIDPNGGAAGSSHPAAPVEHAPTHTSSNQ